MRMGRYLGPNLKIAQRKHTVMLATHVFLPSQARINTTYLMYKRRFLYGVLQKSCGKQLNFSNQYICDPSPIIRTLSYVIDMHLVRYCVTNLEIRTTKMDRLEQTSIEIVEPNCTKNTDAYHTDQRKSIESCKIKC